MREAFSKLKILVVHEVNYLEKIIYEIHEFPELLALRGHDVTFFDFAEGLKKSNLLTTRIKKIKGRVYRNSTISLATPLQLGFPAIDRLLAIFSSVPALVGLFQKNKFDVVLNYAVPTYGFQVLAIARLFRVPVIHRALDVSHLIRESIFNPLIKFWEKVIYRSADYLSANNAAMQEYCVELSGRTKESVVNYPPLDSKHFQFVTYDKALAKTLGIDESNKVIMYMGSFFYFSGLVEAIETFAAQSLAQPHLTMLLIGGGEQDAELRELVKNLGIEKRVIFTGFIPFDDLPRYMKLADIAINTLHPTLVAHVAFPHKVLQYMATGIPTVTTKLDGLYSAFGDQSGLTWISDANEAVSKSIDLLAKPDMLDAVRKSQLSAVKKLFALDTTVDSLESLLKRVSSKGK